MQESNFNLIGIFKTLFQRKVFILLLTLAAFIISIIFCSLQTKQYTAETIFIVKNPLLIDRNYVFRTTNYEHKDFFAVPDDVDHVKTIGESDELVRHIIETFGLAKAYGISDKDELFSRVKKKFKLTREDTKNVELYFTDSDPKRAADITIAARKYIEEKFLNYFLSGNVEITKALNNKSIEIQDTIRILDDSIRSIRSAIDNYNNLLPVRGNALSANGQNANAASAAGLERLQEITVTKDKLVADLANYRSLSNEYQVMASGKISIFYLVQDAYIPEKPSEPKTLIVVAASTLAALFFACILVLISSFYSHVMSSKEKAN